MITNSEPRWGILLIVVLMFLLSLFAGTKGTLYQVFWIYMGYLAYKGEIQKIYNWMKWMIVLCLILGWYVLSRPESEVLRWSEFQTKQEFLLVLAIPVAVKLGIFLYLLTPLSKLSSTTRD